MTSLSWVWGILHKTTNKLIMRNCFLSLLLFLPLMISAGERTVINLKHWQFSRDSIHWQSVTVPHDWAISGPFDKKWDLQMVAITQNGEKQKTEKADAPERCRG